jgi:integrase/recombinase XerD
MDSDLILYRRHSADCKHARKGRDYTKCTCPIWIDGILSGKRWHKTLKTRDWQRAENQRHAIEASEQRIATKSIASTRSVRDALVAYLDDCQARGVRSSTLTAYKITLATLPGAYLKAEQLRMASPSLDTLTPAAMVQWRAGRRVSTGSQIKELIHVKSFFIFCRNMKWLADNPAAVLKAPKSDAQGAAPFTREEVSRILEAARNCRVEMLIKVMLSTGLRISDACSLRRDALDDANYVSLTVLKTRRPIRIQISAPLANALRALPVSGERFFWNHKGSLATFMTNVRRKLDDCVFPKAGITDGHPHRFRDTFAARMFEAGKPIRNVSLMLGHKSVLVTERHYARFIPAQQAMLDQTVAGVDFLGKGNGQ